MTKKTPGARPPKRPRSRGTHTPVTRVAQEIRSPRSVSRLLAVLLMNGLGSGRQGGCVLLVPVGGFEVGGSVGHGDVGCAGLDGHGLGLVEGDVIYGRAHGG
jgi:hypothetical protein